MAKYKVEDIANYTIINGIVLSFNEHWIFLNDESMKEINDLIVEKANNPGCHRAKDEKGRYVKKQKQTT